MHDVWNMASGGMDQIMDFAKTRVGGVGSPTAGTLDTVDTAGTHCALSPVGTVDMGPHFNETTLHPLMGPGGRVGMFGREGG